MTVSQLRAQLLDADLGLGLALGALEAERQRHDPDGERSQLARDSRHHRRRARAGAAAFARRDEDHVRAAQRVLDLVVGLVRRQPADLRIGAGAEPLGQLAADVDLDRRVARLELLDIGVDGDEIDLRDAGVHHPMNRVETGTADARDADDSQVGARIGTDLVQARRWLGNRLDVTWTRRRLVRQCSVRAGSARRQTARRPEPGPEAEPRRCFSSTTGGGGASAESRRLVEDRSVLDGLLGRLAA